MTTPQRLLPLLALLPLSGCSSTPATQRAAVLDYLYPQGVPMSPPCDVHLELPLRVGLVFAPQSAGAAGRTSSADVTLEYQSTFEASAQRQLQERIAAAFRATPGVAAIELVPTSYLRPGGGFENVDQLRALLGIDLVAIVSYDQTQFQDYDRASLGYWTLVGAYFFQGNENETHTFVDVSVFDIPSRALLFNAGGRSRTERESTLLASAEVLRSESRRGFEAAVDSAMQELDVALAHFREQARAGTVRGPGTPNLTVSGEGAGAFGLVEAGLALGLLRAWRRERRGTVSRG
jgi:rhombotail lipoprotein